MFYPKLKSPEQLCTTVQAFLGYEHDKCCRVGAFNEMENLTSAHYPALSPRAPRGILRQLEQPGGMAGKDELAYVDGTGLFWNGTRVPGITLEPEDPARPRQMVSMGAYLIIFPDGIYCNTKDFSDRGSLENRREYPCDVGPGVRYSPCLEDGTEFNRCYIQPTEPQQPQDRAVWVDTSSLPHVFRRYHAEAGAWEQLEHIYTKISFPLPLEGFRAGDFVTIAGCCGPAGEAGDPIRSLNGDFEILEKLGDSAMRVEGVFPDAVYVQQEGQITVTRWVPRMDFVTQCANRLWGCRYGYADGKAVNEIYASALGDFRNWRRFKGLSTDSYAASRGTDGPWTGAATYQNCPLFFKENCVEKVYPSSTGAHQIVTVSCRGVQPGSHKSLAVVGGILYYKASDGICAYDGSLPQVVSEALGPVFYGQACAGGEGDHYYISMCDSGGQAHLFVYDTVRRLWHREDSLRVRDFTRLKGSLLALDEAGRILSMTGDQGTRAERVEWMAQTGALGLDQPGAQVISRVSLRLEPEAGSDLDLWAEYDSSGVWEHKLHLHGPGLRSIVIPILPRRADHLRLRLRGRGGCRIYSLTLTREKGSDSL